MSKKDNGFANEKEILLQLTQKGAAGASEAISKLINKKIKLGVNSIDYRALERISKKLFESETVVATLYLKITGDVAGSIVLIFPMECAHFLIKLLSPDIADRNKTKLNDYEKSVLKEISNIISGAYLKTLSDYLDLSLVESIPDIATDMAQATMDSVLIDFAHTSENAITIDMTINSELDKIQGDFFLLFDAASAEIILNAVQKKIINK